MICGRAEERDPDQVPTRSERLCWYRSGGKVLVDARDNLAKRECEGHGQEQDQQGQCSQDHV
jgi:hypothetical protein